MPIPGGSPSSRSSSGTRSTTPSTSPGRGRIYLLENKIATLLGFPDHKKAEIYDEIDKRARILERLHKAGYVDYKDLFQMLTKVKKEGLIKIGE